MLQRTIHANGVVSYQSALLTELGVPHAFSTRIGGVSTGPFASLNLGNPGGSVLQDDNAHLQENFRRLQDAIATGALLRAWVKQVHGLRVALLEPEPESDYSETLEAEVRDRYHGQTEADALMTTSPHILLSIRVADCVPVLLASADGVIVAAVHAGWRGVVNGIVTRALRAYGELGVSGANLVAAVGPHISARHFEVGEEVAWEFQQAGLGAAVIPGDGGTKPHIDLQRAIVEQLTRGGVTRIDTTAACTYADAGDFYSHRRDAGRTGRMAAVVAVRQPAPAQLSH